MVSTCNVALSKSQNSCFCVFGAWIMATSKIAASGVGLDDHRHNSAVEIHPIYPDIYLMLLRNKTTSCHLVFESQTSPQTHVTGAPCPWVGLPRQKVLRALELWFRMISIMNKMKDQCTRTGALPWGQRRGGAPSGRPLSISWRINCADKWRQSKAGPLFLMDPMAAPHRPDEYMHKQLRSP